MNLNLYEVVYEYKGTEYSFDTFARHSWDAVRLLCAIEKRDLNKIRIVKVLRNKSAN